MKGTISDCRFINNTDGICATIGSKAGNRLVENNYLNIENNLFYGNTNPNQWGGAIYVWDNDNPNPNIIIRNNLFIANSGSIGCSEKVNIYNNLFVQHDLDDGTKLPIEYVEIALSTDGLNSYIANNTFYRTYTAINVDNTPTDFQAFNNLFETVTNALRYNGQDLGNDCDFIEMVVPEFSTNVCNEDPLFAELGTVTGEFTMESYYDVNLGMTILTDSAASWIEHELQGKLIYASEGATYYMFLVADNTETEVLIGFNVPFTFNVADTYAIYDYRLQLGSPCIDTGSPIYTVPLDMDGKRRPAGVTWDKGPFEYGTRVFTRVHVGHSQSYEFHTITDAMAYAIPGETITVAADGNYTAETGEIYPIQFKDRIFLMAEIPGEQPHVIGDGNTSIFYVVNTDTNAYNTNSTRMREFWLSNGGGYESGGIFRGGAFYGEGIKFAVEDCKISDNKATYGGGMYFKRSDATVDNCHFLGNLATTDAGGLYFHTDGIGSVTECKFIGNRADRDGGGLYCIQSEPDITDCEFVWNFAGDDGGAFEIGDHSDPTLLNCLFLFNEALDHGAGGEVYTTSEPKFKNCMFRKNHSNYGAGIHIDYSTPLLANCVFYDNEANITNGSISNLNSNAAIANCIVWNNTPQAISYVGDPEVIYSDIQGGWTGSGGSNIDADPMFGYPEIGDFHLRPGSPCIDVATMLVAPLIDFEGEARPNPDTGICDMGVDEFYDTYNTPAPTLTPTITPTPTLTPTNTGEPSWTPSPTETDTPIPTATDTPTPEPPTATPIPTSAPCVYEYQRSFGIGWTNLGINQVPLYISTVGDLTLMLRAAGIDVTHVANWTASSWEIYQVGLPFNNFTIMPQQGYMVRCNGGGIWTYQVNVCQ